jgi:hypothetical protein
MLKSSLSFILFLILFETQAQQNLYFILIQSDNGQAFHTRIDQKIINSNSLGYLLIPGLRDSTYSISIGYNKNPGQEFQFSIRTGKKDLNLQLKDLGERGLVMEDMQTQELNKPIPGDTSKNQATPRGKKEDNAFSRLLAGVVNDTSVLYNTFISTITPSDSSQADSVGRSKMKGDSVIGRAAIKSDSAINIPAKSTMNAKKKANGPKSAKSTSIKKINETSSSSSLQLVYLDNSGKRPGDTVSMSIPRENKNTAPPQERVQSDVAQGLIKDPGVGGSAKPTGLKLKTDGADSLTRQKQEKKIVLVNSDCKNFANGDDVEKLKQRIQSVTDPNQRIAVAKKYFKTKCFTVDQIRSLDDLFSGDEWKFKFFDTAYPFVSDSDNFSQLSAQLSEETYIARFKALISKP